MKKIWFAPLIITALLLISTNGITYEGNEAVSNAPYRVSEMNTKVSWTAYKTSVKIPVTGVFDKIIIENPKDGSSIVDAMNGLTFKIPVNGINSLSKLRDGKIIKSFFGAMLNTINLTGSIELKNDNKGQVLLKMNGVSKSIPVTYSITDKTITIEGVMDVNNWAAQAAMESLNDACEDLHTGPDGESITWSEVKINAVTQF